MELIIENIKNGCRVRTGVVYLKDDSKAEGGISHQNETLEEFIESDYDLKELVYSEPGLFLGVLNKVLEECGIMPVFPILNALQTTFVIKTI